MFLKRLEIQGFKTFATPTVLEFRPGITAIIGPNGSGKSNIADAVRWVLGEQSNAALRCKRTEELLFSGNARRPPAAVAEVSLTIDNSDHLLPLASNEITITRRAMRGGGSEYLINRTRVNLRDIQAATEPLGSSYTIINQGLVDMALTLRPEERRRLFESAAEIGGFEMRKNEAERRLRETDSNIQRVADLLSELEPRLRSLKRQSAQARQHREISDELHRLLMRHYAAQWQAAHTALLAAEEHATRLEQEREHLRTTQASATDELQRLRDTLRSHREHLGNLHQQYSQLHARAETIQRELAGSDERLAALTYRAEELQRSHNDLAARAAEATHERATAHVALQAIEADLAEQRTRITACQDEVSEHAAARQAREQELKAAQEAAMHAATIAATQLSRSEQLATQRERLANDQAKLQGAIQQAAEHLASAQQQVETIRAATTAAETARDEAAQQEATAREELERLRQERSQVDEQLSTTRRSQADAEARLESLNRLARSYSGTFPGVKAAMQWAERSGRNGFALVSSIIRVPDGLETALEVALGGRLHNIVVETWHDAEDAIVELKRSGAGRATFLPLDTIRGGNPGSRNHSRTTANHDAPVLGVAADLVEYDDHYYTIVQHLLGRTLVARDLKTARQELQRLHGGWMIVTIGGEQVSSGGAVTGGAQTKESGILQRERELRELPEQVQSTRASIGQLETRRHDLDEQMINATRSLREAETRHREASRLSDMQQTTLERAMQRATQSEQELSWRRDNYEIVSDDLATLTRQEATLVQQQHEAETRAAATQEHLSELRTRQEADSQADRAAQERLNSLRTELASVEGQARVQQSLITTHQRTLDQLARQQSEVVRQIEALTEERAHITHTRISSETTYQALLHEMEALQAQISPADETLKRYEMRQAELESQESRLTVALLEQENSHNRATFDLQRARDQLDYLHERTTADGITEPLHHLPDQIHDLADQSETELHARIEQLRERLRRLGGVNPLALEEYEEVAKRHEFQRSQLDDLRQARATLRELITELEKTMQKRFVETFRAVAVEFERYFTRLFGGGTARLELVGRHGSSARNEGDGTSQPSRNGDHREDAHQVVEEEQSAHEYGIEIVARPPGKRQQNLALLSGGERTLTASALLFALLTVNPSPFCILDEVDAALDESNVGRFREVLHDLTRQTQFILITHNRGTIEAADTLYGISMGDDSISKVLSLRIETIEGLDD